MAHEIFTLEDLQQFRSQLLEDIKGCFRIKRKQIKNGCERGGTEASQHLPRHLTNLRINGHIAI